MLLEYRIIDVIRALASLGRMPITLGDFLARHCRDRRLGEQGYIIKSLLVRAF